MDNFLTYTDFSGLIIFDTESESSKAFLNDVIADVQKRILIDLLGYDLYLQFETGLSAGSPDQKWLDLRDGANFSSTYENISYTLHFGGVKQMLKLFTAFYYQVAISNKMTFAGQVQNVFENSKVVNQNINIIKNYNKAIDFYGFAYDNENVEILTNVYFESKRQRLLDSCFNFIYTKNESDSTTYTNWIFKPKTYIF